jgi:hypothetical protein
MCIFLFFNQLILITFLGDKKFHDKFVFFFSVVFMNRYLQNPVVMIMCWIKVFVKTALCEKCNIVMLT